MPSGLNIVPVTLRDARLFIEEHHSHHYAPNRAIAKVGVEYLNRLVCVALLERPKSRVSASDRFTAEVTRVASDGTVKHAASKCLGAIARAGLALGYTRLVSYTILGEAGTTYRAAGWYITGITSGGQWSRPSRFRVPGIQPGRKVRWEFGPGANSRCLASDDMAKRMIGNVKIPGRDDRLSLFGEIQVEGVTS